MPEQAGWKSQAACKGKTRLFFSTEKSDIRAAKQICRERCPVRRQCGAAALLHDERGVWGGFDEKDRKGMAVFVYSEVRVILEGQLSA